MPLSQEEITEIENENIRLSENPFYANVRNLGWCSFQPNIDHKYKYPRIKDEIHVGLAISERDASMLIKVPGHNKELYINLYELVSTVLEL